MHSADNPVLSVLFIAIYQNMLADCINIYPLDIANAHFAAPSKIRCHLWRLDLRIYFNAYSVIKISVIHIQIGFAAIRAYVFV